MLIAENFGLDRWSVEYGHDGDDVCDDGGGDDAS